MREHAGKFYIQIRPLLIIFFCIFRQKYVTHVKICILIVCLGIKLGLKHITICSAAVYFHKFYKHVNEHEYDNYVSFFFI